MTSTDAPLLLGRDGAVATIRFNRPTVLNAIDVPMALSFLSAVRDIAADRDVRAVLLSGAGDGFMAGGDLAVLKADPQGGAAALIEPMHEAMMMLGRIDAPVVAQVHGVAAGAGMSLMLQADFVVAALGTRFELSFVKIGASCDTGSTWALPRRVGLHRALEIAMLGDTLDAAAAERIGLVNRVVPVADLEREASGLAARLAAGPTAALGHIRRLMRGAYDRDFSAQLQAEADAFRECAGTADFKAGVDAFFAKKPARFIGR